MFGPSRRDAQQYTLSLREMQYFSPGGGRGGLDGDRFFTVAALSRGVPLECG
jgi:hypothetical protein